MSILGIDLGGTKLAAALFNEEGKMLFRDKANLGNRQGPEVGKLITDKILVMIRSAEKQRNKVKSIGLSVPGISNSGNETVWAPNIPGWAEYPLLAEVKGISEKIPVVIDSDRACYVLGESWQGNAKGCRDVIFLSVGTGIGAGILADGKILRGSNDIAGAIGWMALSRPFENKYTDCGCFEYYASGRGIAGIAANLITEDKSYNGELKKKAIAAINPNDVFAAYENSDLLALKVVRQCLEFWGMAVANLVSLFNPEKIIFGGGLFGPAVKLIPLIRQEAEKWAQPISIKKVTIESSGLEGDAGVFGAAYLALKNLL